MIPRIKKLNDYELYTVSYFPSQCLGFRAFAFFYHAPAKTVLEMCSLSKSLTRISSLSRTTEKKMFRSIESCQQPASPSFCLRSAKVDDLLNRLFIFQQIAVFHDCKVHRRSYRARRLHRRCRRHLSERSVT